MPFLGLAALGSLVLALAAAAPVLAQGQGTPGVSKPESKGTQALPETPPGFEVSAREAIGIADREPDVGALRERHGELEASVEAKGDTWEVAYAADEERVALVVVDGPGGQVRDIWTGAQVAWQMARGNEGQFGHVLNSPYVWVPLSAIFLFGLLDLRRLRRIGHLDLLVLLAFGISHIFFNDGEIGVSVPLVYPLLVYLLLRMLWIGFRGEGGGLRPTAPIALLVVVAVFLVGSRVAINIRDSGVIDVGYAGVVGAERITSGEPIYGEGEFPSNNPTGDTYGPANYYAYVPFELALPWSGTWDDLPAGHAAAIFFDLATLAGLFVLGSRLRSGREGRDLGVVLAFAWAAYPYTAFALQSNSNDSLVAALLVWAFIAFASPVGRAVLLGLAATAKFAPIVLAPLFAAGEQGLGRRLEGIRRGHPALLPVAYFTTVFIATAVLVLLHPAVDPGLATFWDRTVASQLGRESPFSIWGQVSALQPIQTVVTVGAAALAAALAFVPRRRSRVQLVALSAAVLIATQLAVEHWFYLYIPWFFGLLMAGIAPQAEGRRSVGGDADQPPVHRTE